MKSQRITNASIFYAFVSGLLLAGTVGIRLIRPVDTLVNDPILASLTQQASSLNEFHQVALSKAVEESNSAKTRLWDDKRIADFTDSASKAGWIIQPIGASEAVYTINRRFLIRRVDLSFTHWPDMVKFMKDTSRAAGCSIENITIDAAPGEKRSFTTFQAVISLPQQKTNPQSPNPTKS